MTTGISTSTRPMVVRRLTQVPPSILTKVKIHTMAIQAIPAGTGLFKIGKNVEIRNCGNPDGRVTNPVCMIIKDTGLETERRRYFASVGNRTALLRVLVASRA
nr:Uncharacterised protein [Klebsiella pneumoniae]